jgi:eukaryotic-like serine/threonine-protein kinase
MRVVYRAFDPRLDQQVALKVLRGDERGAREKSDERDTGATGATARLLREARAAAALGHPNAVAIFDLGEVNGEAFIAMELVSGRTLRAFIGQPLVPIATRLRWLYEVARVLAAAHRAGLVHRDVKPENVMIRDDGDIKVLDFGIARGFRSDSTPPSERVEGGTVAGGSLTLERRCTWPPSSSAAP